MDIEQDNYNKQREILNKEQMEDINYICAGKRMTAKLNNSYGLIVAYILIILPSFLYWIFVYIINNYLEFLSILKVFLPV
jgi:hypothetical protein